MAKRGAVREINHDNWDQEEEPEEAGIFKQASEDIIKQRSIKKAKRRGFAGQGDDSGGGVTVFKGFSGFASTAVKPSFSFNKDNSKPLSGLSNGGAAPFSLGGQSSFGAPKTDNKLEGEKKQETTTNGSTTGRSKYLQQLRALNESVTKWITDHINKNPHCVLTPIFRDYEKHLAEVEKLNPDRGTGSAVSSEKDASPAKSSAAVSTTPTFSLTQGGSDLKCSKNTSDSTQSSFGGLTTKTESSTSTLFSSSGALSSFSSGFSFKPATTSDTKPFSFATSSASTSVQSENKDNEEEDYEPPKAEVKEIKEDDAIYTKRCKLYYQKSGAWVERGIGNLHLKPCGEKTQLLIRADTNLGNILLNIMLTKSIPLARQGKSNVSMLCVMNPPIDKSETEKPTSLLIRVKTAEEADQLLEKLKDNQK